MTRRKNAQRLIAMLLSIALCLVVLAGCNDKAGERDNPSPTGSGSDLALLPQEQFDILLDELFEESVTSDSISLNYYLANPARYGIEPITPTYGEVTSQENILRDREESRELFEKLKGFEYEHLRADQQIIYDMFMRTFDIYETLDKKDEYSYYLGAVHPISGIQVQLPILLAEFNFRTAEDIEVYLQLLGDTQRYFGELIEFERERSNRGFFMSDANVDEVIANCESFMEDREDNLLLVIFDDKIDKFPGLDEEQREQFKQRNRDLVLNNVLAAYDMLVDAMRELRGKGANQGGLANLPDGEEFAVAYLRSKTGSDRTLQEVSTLLKGKMDEAIATMISVIEVNPALWDSYVNGALGSLPSDTPESYLRLLEKNTTRDFPGMESVTYVVNEVHESLQEFISPAFYLTPAVDDFANNVIYINPSKISDNMSLFTTLAHEGYPGHLYQSVYYLQQNPHFLRKVMPGLGYTEGWATYVEMWSYFNAGLDEDEAAMLLASNLFNLLLIARFDLGVNGYGWGENEMSVYLSDLGYGDAAMRLELLKMVTADPFSYLPYALGYLEFVGLRDEAQDALGAAFDLVEFHRFVLGLGPTPFSLIRDYMQDWIEAQSSQTLAPAA